MKNKPTAFYDEIYGESKESNLEVIATGILTVVFCGIVLALVIMFQ